MIVVDSSVWIAHFRNQETPQVRVLRELARQEPLAVGDVILLEVLQGARDDAAAQRIEHELRKLVMVSMLGPALAARAAEHYRRLRGLGITVRKLADMVIGTYCIERGWALLHADRDYEPMQLYLGLQVVLR